jgi:hypothetical protein
MKSLNGDEGNSVSSLGRLICDVRRLIASLTCWISL